MPPESRVKLIPAQQTYSLRHRVLRPNQSLSECTFQDDDAPSTVHFGAFQDGHLVGIASLYKESRPNLAQDTDWRLRGMATDLSVRGEGFGRKLVQACLRYGEEHGADAIWCNARSTAAGFYRDLGFRTVGEEFYLPEIGPHFVMVFNLRTESSNEFPG